VIVECKTVKELTALNQAQLLNYLKITSWIINKVSDHRVQIDGTN